MKGIENEKWLISTDMGTTRDAATIIDGAINNGWTCHGVMIDLARNAKDHDRIYEYMECIKQGSITATKYVGGHILFNKPYMIVFANWLPKVHKLSLDRWDIRRLIKKDEDIFMENIELDKNGNFVNDLWE